MMREVFSANGIDANFRLKRKIDKSRPGSGITFYQNVLSQTLFSSCDFFPSDSLKAQLNLTKYSSPYTILAAVERLYREPDAAKVGHEIVQIKNKNYYLDLNDDSNLFKR